MRGKTHCTIGILSTIQACILFKVPITIFNLLLAAIFSILPDLDESNSTISNVILKQDASKFILKIVIYIINFAIFFVSLKLNDNFLLSSIVTFISIMVLESKLNHTLLRKILLSLTLVLLSLCLFFIKTKIYFVIFFLILASFPWLKHRSFSHSIFAA
ncbi:MAG: metal-dependent hydrolase, partial [Romboutsia sp.]|nr:metal-dependent hydrolase [Romboutsia sp.]